jgi:hypothetical protein
MYSAIMSRVRFEVWQTQELEMNKVEALKACDTMLLPNWETNILTILQMVRIILLSLQKRHVQPKIHKSLAKRV